MNQLDRIAELWAQGLITEEIAKRLGSTKGSVCRKARDARLKGDARFPARPRHALVPRTQPKPKPKPRPLLVDLPPNGCKYPVLTSADDNTVHFFCAEPRKPGSPYCAEHDALCSAKLRPALANWVRH